MVIKLLNIDRNKQRIGRKKGATNHKSEGSFQADVVDATESAKETTNIILVCVARQPTYIQSCHPNKFLR